MRFLIDETFPPSTVEHLEQGGAHEADHVRHIGLPGTTDADVAHFARANALVVVTENVVDFTGIDDLTIVFVLKRNLPAGGAQAAALAALLRRWADANPRPYLGRHWPT